MEQITSVIAPLCTKFDIAGSYRREAIECGDLEIVCQPISPTPVALAFKDAIGCRIVSKFTRDSRYVKLFTIIEGLQIDLFLPQPADYYRQLAIRTGSADYAHRTIAGSWRKKGWVGTDRGLRLEVECKLNGKVWECVSSNPTLPPVWDSEEDFFTFLGLYWIEPKFRG